MTSSDSCDVGHDKGYSFGVTFVFHVIPCGGKVNFGVAFDAEVSEVDSEWSGSCSDVFTATAFEGKMDIDPGVVVCVHRMSKLVGPIDPLTSNGGI